MRQFGVQIFMLRHEISNNVVCTTSKASDQPVHMCSLIRAFAQGRRRRSGRTASAGPLFGPSMLSAVSLFLVSAHFTFYSDFIQSAKIY